MKKTFSMWSQSIRRFFSKRSLTLGAFSREWIRERSDEGKIKVPHLAIISVLLNAICCLN